jgi:hypothetical protein
LTTDSGNKAPRLPDSAGEELRLAGLLIDAASGTMDNGQVRAAVAI